MSISVGRASSLRFFDFFAAVRESRGNAWPTTLRARCSGLHSNSRLAKLWFALVGAAGCEAE